MVISSSQMSKHHQLKEEKVNVKMQKYHSRKGPRLEITWNYIYRHF